MDDRLRKNRELLQNPYAYLGEDGYEYSLPKNRTRTISSKASTPSSIATIAHKSHQIIESRKLLQNQYAHIDDEGGYSALTPSETPALKGVLPEKRRSYNDDEIETIATNLLRETYRQRHLLWDGVPPKSPFKQISPTTILKGIGYSTEIHESLDIAEDAGGAEFSVAGIFDRDNKRVLISQTFPPHIRHFTLAHELGHAVLHQGQGMHRDRPVDGITQRSGAEREADKFAVCITMPAKLVRKVFNDRFLIFPFLLTPETEFALFGLNHNVKLKSIRDLSRHMAKARAFNRQNFPSLAEQFNVSVEAMAIRLEELGLVNFSTKD
jgi:Zn-dependent peptidase ImmA (M78 family)